MKFSQRDHGVTLRDKVRSSEICKSFNVEPFLELDIPAIFKGGDQNVTGIMRLSRVLLATSTGKQYMDRPGTR